MIVERLRIILPAVLISILGIMNTYSITHTYSMVWMKQTMWLFLSILVYLLASRFDYVELYKRARPIYLLTFLLLVMVFIIGKECGGAKRWLSLYVVNIQPVEIMKLSLVIMLARYIEDRWRDEGFDVRELIVPLVITLIPALIVIMQPDLGSAGLVILIGGSMMLIAGVKKRSLLVLITGLVITFPILWFFGMHEYQRERILTFLDPLRDPWGKGYQIIQSIIAIGSGGVVGKGFLHGTQSRLRFLPAPHTDFAFAVWCEEWGLLGAIVLFSLSLWLIINLLKLASIPRRRFGAYMVIGFTLMIFIQIMVNVYMVTGMFPVVGVPYPFFGYGGSSLLSMFFALGISASVKSQHLTYTLGNRRMF